jgi:hypothetical protein
MLKRLPKPWVAVALALGVLAGLAPSGLASGGAAAAAIPAAGALPSTPAPLGGVNIVSLGYEAAPVEADRAIALAAQLHAKVVRTELPWAVFEPTAAGQIAPQALAFTDRLLADAAAAGMKVIAEVDTTPCWASSAPPALLGKCSTTELTHASDWPPTDPSAYASFVAYLAQRYGSELAAIEVWNEPDQANELYFAGPEKAVRYAAILRAAYTAIKQANPSVPVLAGALVGSNGAFLRALYAAGIKGYYDGLAVHYYNLTLGSVRSIREVQLANGDTKPLWLDEFGWTSCWPQQSIQEEQACVTPQVQAANIKNVFRSLAHTSYVAAAVMFKLQDSRGEEFGVLSLSGAHKLSFAALASVLASPFGKVSPVTLTLRRSNGRVVASGSGPVGDFMELEAWKRGVLRYRALFTLDRFNRYSINLPHVLGTRSLRVRVYQYWAGLGAAAQKST